MKMQSHGTLVHYEISIIICCCRPHFICKLNVIHSPGPIVEDWAVSNDTVREL